MSQFRKRPVVVEATQWFRHGDHPSVQVPDRGSFVAIVPSNYGMIATLEGAHVVTPGDWIITGVAGETYPCKPDIFEQTYEAVDAQQEQLNTPRKTVGMDDLLVGGDDPEEQEDG